VRKIILDVDTGVDDAVALILAMNSPEVLPLAITTVAGNAPVCECTRNCLLLTELLAPECPPPVAEGAAAPLEKELVTAPEVHGWDGLGGDIGSLPTPDRSAIATPAHELLIEIARRHPGEVTLVATGPLTNLARAHERDPEAMALYERIVVMGGAFGVPGNTGPVAEFNFYVDPEAAGIMMNARLNVTLVPLDATTEFSISWKQIVDLARKSGHAGQPARPKPRPGKDLGDIVFRALDHYVRFQREESGLHGAYMHDPIAVASALEPSLIEGVSASVAVMTEGDDRGQSLCMSPPVTPSGIEIALYPDWEMLHALIVGRALARAFPGSLSGDCPLDAP